MAKHTLHFRRTWHEDHDFTIKQQLKRLQENVMIRSYHLVPEYEEGGGHLQVMVEDDWDPVRRNTRVTYLPAAQNTLPTLEELGHYLQGLHIISMWTTFEFVIEFKPFATKDDWEQEVKRSADEGARAI